MVASFWTLSENSNFWNFHQEAWGICEEYIIIVWFPDNPTSFQPPFVLFFYLQTWSPVSPIYGSRTDSHFSASPRNFSNQKSNQILPSYSYLLLLVSIALISLSISTSPRTFLRATNTSYFSVPPRTENYDIPIIIDSHRGAWELFLGTDMSIPSLKYNSTHKVNIDQCFGFDGQHHALFYGSFVVDGIYFPHWFNKQLWSISTHKTDAISMVEWTSPLVCVISRIRFSMKNQDSIVKTVSLCRASIRCKLYLKF